MNLQGGSLNLQNPSTFIQGSNAGVAPVQQGASMSRVQPSTSQAGTSVLLGAQPNVASILNTGIQPQQLAVESLPTQQSFAGEPFNPFNHPEEFNIWMDPDTRDINIDAPDYFINSPEFQDEILPFFQRLEGQNITDQQLQQFLTDEDLISNVRRQMREVVKPRTEAIESLRRQYGSFSEDDAMLALRNMAAAYSSESDEDTQVVVGRLDDGSFDTTSVAELVEKYREVDDIARANLRKNLRETVENEEAESTDRAIALGVLGFIDEKGIGGASEEAQKERRSDVSSLRFAQETLLGQLYDRFDRTTVGKWLAGVINPDLKGMEDGRIARLERRIAEDERNELPDINELADQAAMRQGLANLGVDLVSAGGVSGVIRGGVHLIGSAAVRGSMGTAGFYSIQKTAELSTMALSASRKVWGGERLLRGVARETPYNLSFGLVDAGGNFLNDRKEGNSLRNFMIDTGLSAGGIMLIRGAGRIASALDNIPVVHRASEAVSQRLFQAKNWINNLPGVGRVGKAISTGIFNKNAPSLRIFDAAFAKGIINQNQHKAMYNLHRMYNMNGQGYATTVRDQSAAYKKVSAARESMSPEQLAAANEFNNLSMVIEHADRGGYGNLSKKQATRLNEMKARRDELGNTLDGEVYQGYRQDLIDYNTDITNFGHQSGLTDADLFDVLIANDSLTGDYTRLQFGLEDGKRIIDGEQVATFEKTQPVGRLRGLSEMEALDPLLVANQRLNMIAEMRATNDLRIGFAEMIEQGIIPGRVVTRAEDVAKLNRLQGDVQLHKALTGPEIKKIADDVGGDFAKLWNTYTISGGGNFAAGEAFEESIKEIVDKAVERMMKSKRFRFYADKYAATPKEGVTQEAAERALAYEMLDSQRRQMTDALKTRLAKTKLDADDQVEFANRIRASVNAETQKAIAQADGTVTGVNDKFQEAKQLYKEVNPVDTPSESMHAYYRDGGKGYIEVADPELQRFIGQMNNPVELGWVGNIARNAARVFRFGTTGVEPVFTGTVAPIRAGLFGSVTTGWGFLTDPSITRRPFFEAIGLPQTVGQKAIDNVNQFMRGGDFISLNRATQNAVRAQSGAAATAGAGRVQSTMLNMKRTFTHPLDSLRHPGEVLRRVEDVVALPEQVFRSRAHDVAYTGAKRRGMTEAQAQTEGVFAAVNAMADYSNVGKNIEKLVRSVPLMNAGIQGSSSFMRMWRTDPIGITTRLTAGVVMPIWYLTARNFSSEENIATYYKVPEWEREMNFIVVLGEDNVLKIPMEYPLAGIANPIRQFAEASYGMGEYEILRSLAKGLSIMSPLDTTGFFEQGMDRGVDLEQGARRLAGSVTPAAIRPMTQIGMNRDLYTGAPIGPTDDELISRGQVGVSDDIRGQDRTFRNRDSQLLRNVSDFVYRTTGIDVDQSTLQQFVGAAGPLGGRILNAVDKAIGAPEERQGGQGLMEALSRRFLNTDPQAANIDFNKGVRDLEAQREQLKTRLEKLGTDEVFEADYLTDEDVNERRQELIGEYAQNVADFAEKFANYYEQAGGISSSQKRRLVNLMNTGTALQGQFDAGTFQRGQATDMFFAERDAGIGRAVEFGLPMDNERDMFGRMLRDDEGEVRTEFSNTSPLMQHFRSMIFGAPRQLAYEFEQIIKADKQAGIPSLRDVMSEYWDIMNPMFEEARELSGDAATAMYDQINQVQREYLRDHFDPRIKPLIDKYGPSVLNNNQVVKEISDLVLIPGDFTPFHSASRQPYLTRDTRAFIRDRYGVGNLNTQNLPTDTEVRDVITRVNRDVEAGRMGSAAMRLQDVQQDIAHGRAWVDEDTMDEIAQLIDAVNRRR